ncbi:MAG TPA: DHA2 family efflux MFS transporter permease subunit, partial [Pseudonocardiaceae bacterium]|nr:DHA2 family efflux MFS transporter permease subunit [Pseudonocardiaceae bacterium]
MSSPAGAVAPAAAPSARAGWGLPLLVLIVGMFMSILDTSIVNVAIPTLQNEFGVATDDVQWVITAYTLMLGVVVPASAWLGDRFGLDRLYNVALVGFAAGSALCGLAWDLNSLVVFRIVQAIPGGILPVVSLPMVYRIVPREKIGAAMGLYGLGIVVAPAIGPTLGGYLVEYVNWRLIFYINVPVGILGAVAAALVLPKFSGVPGRRFDLLGFLTIAGGLFTLLLALSEGESWGWNSYRILGLITVSALLLALFIVIELEVDDPLLDVRVFRYWAFTNSLLLISVLMVGLFGVLFYIPLFLQAVQGFGALDAGVTLLPQALVMAVLMPFAGRLYDRIGPRWPATIGVTIVAVATYLMHSLTLDTSREQLIWWLMLRAVGLGIAMMPIMTGGLAAIPTAQVNAASAFNNVAQRTSAALGLAVLTAIFTKQSAEQMAGRAALLPSDTAIPHLGGPSTPDWLGVWAVYHHTQMLVFVGALDDLLLIAAGLSAVGALGALLLRSGPAPAPSARVAVAQQRSAPAVRVDAGPGQDGAVGRDFVPDRTSPGGAAGNGRSVGSADRMTDLGVNARTRE